MALSLSLCRLPLFLALALPLAAQSIPKPAITPPREHPRLVLRAPDVAALRQRIAATPAPRAWARVMQLSQADFTGELPATADNYDPRIHEVTEACALRYLVQQDAPSGEKAVAIMRRVLPNVTYPDKQDITRQKGATIFTAAVVYDWCYPLLTAADRDLFIKHMKRIAKLTEIGYPPTRQGAVTGHGGEAQILRDQLGGGIAVYDEDPEMYNFAAGRILAEFVPVRNFFYPSHWHHQGSSYGPYRFNWEIMAAWLFKRMAGVDIFTREQAQVPYAWVYARRPDGALFVDGDAPSQLKRNAEPPAANNTDYLTASYYHDPVLAGVSARLNAIRDRQSDSLWYLLFADPNLAPAPVTSLPLTRYFADPAGIMIARTGWNWGRDSRDVVAQLKIAPWMFNNHQHLDAGHFQLWYRGLLASDSGIYQGGMGGYGSDHDLNYHKRSIAQNTVLVLDPNEKPMWGSKPVANDGGQRWPANGREFANLAALQESGRVGTVLTHAIGPDAQAPWFSHLSGDITHAYSDKVRRFVRSFVFVNLAPDATHPAALLVYDRIVSAQPTFKKTWLLHTLDEPQVGAGGFTVRGVWGGRMEASVLLPKAGDAALSAVGGEGREFTVNGTNYPQIPRQGKLSDTEAAAWRVELSPKTPRTDDRFLVALQVMDGEPNVQPLPVKHLEGTGWTGVQIGSAVVVFPGGEEDLPQLSLSLPSPARCCLTGLAPGRWRIQHAGGETTLTATADGHAVMFEAPAGPLTATRTGP